MNPDLRAQLQAALGATYTVERELGGGGMARVFVATEAALGRRVVVKVLPPDLTAELSVERFRREIQVAAQLQSPHIVPLLSAGEGAGLLYYTMPFVDGESLRARLSRDGELPFAVAVQMMRDIAKALAYAHRRGVVHRDIKPENILLSDGEALVADFGVAKALSASTTAAGGITSIGMAIGTPAYMAPEQAAGDASVDARADLYALGAVAYEMLTGSTLFPGRSPQALVAAHTTETPESIERRRPNIPVPLASLVMRLLAKRPADRPQTADDVLRELDAITTTGGTALTAAGGAGPRVTLRVTRAIVAAAAIALVAGGALLLRGRRPHAAAPIAAGETSVAVLPFVNIGGDKENQYFSDGMTDELIDRLANIRGLRVSARTSSFALKPGLDAPEIGRQLHVRNLVEGSVRRAGSHIRVTAQLIDADSGFHRWSHSYDGDLKDVFAVQQQIGTAIAAELRVELAGRDSALLAHAPTADTAAHRLYLQGLFFWNKRTGDALRRAATLLRDAIAHDSNYAEAYSALAETFVLYPSYLDVRSDPYLDTAAQMAKRAIALDSTLSAPHAALGSVYGGAWRFDESWPEFDRAIALRSTDATAHHWKGYQLCVTGRHREGAEELRTAEQLDPLSRVIGQDLSTCLIMGRDFVRAEREARHVIDLDSTFVGGWGVLGAALTWQGHADSAIAVIKHQIALAGPEPYAGDVMGLAIAFIRAGKRDSAVAWFGMLERRARSRYVSPAALGVIALHLGDRDHAVQLFRQAIEARDGVMVDNFPANPVFDPLRGDPRFVELKHRINLP